MMKVIPVFGVSAIALLIPIVFGHPQPSSAPSCALTEKGEKKSYRVGDVVELHCPEHDDKDEKYKVVCTDESSWLALTECHGKKPTQEPAPPPKTDPPKKAENPPMPEPRPYRPRMPRRRPYMRPGNYRRPMRPRMPDHGPDNHDMRRDHDEDRPHQPPQPKPYRPPHKPAPPAHTMPPKPTTKATTTPPHIIPPANQVKPLNKPTRQGMSCSLRLMPYFFPYDPFDPQAQRGNVPSGRSIVVRCPGHNFNFYAYCYNGTFYWPQNLCPPGYKR